MALLYTGANLTLQGVTLVCQFAVLAWVPPREMGVWQTALIVEQYFLISRLGIVNAMNREYPYLLGIGEREKGFQVVETAQAYAFFNGLMAFALFLFLSLANAARGSTWRIALVAMSVVALTQIYNAYLEGTYRSSADFRALSMIRFAEVPVHFVSLLLPYKFGFDGFCLRAATLGAISTVVCYIFRPVKTGPRFQWKVFLFLLSSGWRLYLWSYLSSVGKSFSRLVLTGLAGTQAIGLFAPVHWMTIGFTSLTGSLSAYLYPTLTFRFARDGAPVGKKALQASLITVVCLLPVALLGVLLMPWLFARFLAQYVQATTAAQVALCAGLLESFSIATVAFAAMKAWRPMAWQVAASLAIRAGGALVGFFLIADKVLGVSIGAAVSAALLCFVTWFTVRRADVSSGRRG